jgi:hypothetical protein
VGTAGCGAWTEGFSACPTLVDAATAGASGCSGMPYQLNFASMLGKKLCQLCKQNILLIHYLSIRCRSKKNLSIHILNKFMKQIQNHNHFITNT